MTVCPYDGRHAVTTEEFKEQDARTDPSSDAAKNPPPSPAVTFSHRGAGRGGRTENTPIELFVLLLLLLLLFNPAIHTYGTRDETPRGESTVAFSFSCFFL